MYQARNFWQGSGGWNSDECPQGLICQHTFAKKIEASLVSTELQTRTRAVSVMAVFYEETLPLVLDRLPEKMITLRPENYWRQILGVPCVFTFSDEFEKSLFLLFFYLAPAEEERKKCILKMVQLWQHEGRRRRAPARRKKKEKLVRAYSHVLLEKGAKTPFYRESPCQAYLQTFFSLHSSRRCFAFLLVDIC